LAAGNHRGAWWIMIRSGARLLRLPAGASIEQKSPMLAASDTYSLNIRLDAAAFRCQKYRTVVDRSTG